MTTYALCRYFSKTGKGRLQIACNTGIFGDNCKPACGTMHLGSRGLHPLRHIFGNFRSAVQPERRHSKPCFRDLGCRVRIPGTEILLNFLQREEMLAHIRQRVLDQGRRKRHELP